MPERRARQPLAEAEFVRTLARELARSERTTEIISMMVLDLVQARPEDLESLLDYLQKRLRLTDEIGWLDESHFAVLLPSTTGKEAAIVAESIADSLGDAQARINWRLHSSDQDEDVSGNTDKRDVHLHDQDLDPPHPTNGHPRNDRAPADRKLAVEPLAPLLLVAIPPAKRALDILVALPALILLSPILLLVAIAIRLDSRGDVLFRQSRVGQGGRVFQLLKFRTMVDNAEDLLEDLQGENLRDGPAFKIHQDPRVTRVGRIIRGIAVDELPQLWNVLMGDMTLVGPRPHLPREVVQYEPWHRSRLRVVSGLTCIWQVDGRLRNVSFADWVRQDIRYGTQYSPKRDLGLIARTAWVVLSNRGDR